MRSWWQPLRRAISGSDGPGKRALPAGEFLHPLPLLAVAVLVLNDHYLKGAGILPGAVTGKLSDIVGLFFFPLLLTAAADCLLLALSRLGLAIDFSLRRWKIAAAIAATGAVFTAMKLSPAVADAVAAALGALAFKSAVVADPTDLIALPSLALAYALARREIARVPLGRLEVLEKQGPSSVAAGLSDVAACGADPLEVADLSEHFAAYLRGNEEKIETEQVLARLRGEMV